MPENPYFRKVFGNQPVNGYQKLLKSSRHYLCPIFPWIWNKLSWKRSALVRSKILGLFVNTLTVEYKYSRRNIQTFAQQVQTPLSLKQKTFSWFFIAFLESTWNGEDFQKKAEFSRLSTSEIIKCLKGLTSEQLSLNNLLTGSKHCLSLYGTTIILFFQESGINWAG